MQKIKKVVVTTEDGTEQEFAGDGAVHEYNPHRFGEEPERMLQIIFKVKENNNG